MIKHFALASAFAAIATVCAAQEWGDLEGQFIYKGTPPTPKVIVPDKDQAVCGKHKLFEEDVVVDKATGGISGICVYLFTTPTTKIDIHPDLAKPPSEGVLVDNKNCRFEPHVAAVRTGQKLTVGNGDPIGHNTKAEFFNNASFNDLIPAGGRIEKTFNASESTPVLLQCSIHAWMKGYLLVRDNPYFAVTDKEGKFSIKNLPAGKHTFVVWHPTGYLVDVTVDGKPTKWQIGTRSKGRVEVDIKAGANSLGKKIEATPAAK
jgi:plastocyanin